MSGDREPSVQWLTERLHGRPLAITLGGIRSGIGIPPFEFRRILDGLDANVLLLRDLRQCWYHLGVGDGIRTPIALAGWLDALSNELSSPRTTLIGNSAGGYGALMIGSMMSSCADTLAISPQTFIGKSLRRQHGDRRWRREIRRTHRFAPAGATFDLIDQPGKLVGAIHYSQKHELDAVHAERMAIRTSLRIVPHAGDFGHRLVAQLRDEGLLERLLQELVFGYSPP